MKNRYLSLITGVFLILNISCQKDDEAIKEINEQTKKETTIVTETTISSTISTTEEGDTSDTNQTDTSSSQSESENSSEQDISSGIYANRTVWVYGVNGPSFREHKDQWVVTESSERLPWKPEYGWYDCNKISTNGNRYADHNLCWAATASNMLHWWITQNKIYIEKYMKLQTTPNFVKEYPHTYPKRQTLSRTNNEERSDIFALFTERWSDKGGYINDGINWFISGWQPRKGGIIIKGERSRGGYFSEVFPDTNDAVGYSKSIAYTENGISKSRLNTLLKDAFENKKAIGFSYPGHAMTIWAAEFDANGEVDYIYYVNNNYGENDEELNGGALVRAKILVIGDYGVGYSSNKEYYNRPNSINKLILLPLYQEKWESFLRGK